MQACHAVAEARYARLRTPCQRSAARDGRRVGVDDQETRLWRCPRRHGLERCGASYAAADDGEIVVVSTRRRRFDWTRPTFSACTCLLPKLRLLPERRARRVPRASPAVFMDGIGDCRSAHDSLGVRELETVSLTFASASGFQSSRTEPAPASRKNQQAVYAFAGQNNLCHAIVDASVNHTIHTAAAAAPFTSGQKRAARRPPGR